MKIILTGGGSGGHITPILAVADELKKLQADTTLVYIGQKGDKLADIASQSRSIDQSYMVSAGKWRRYHGEGWRQVLDIKTMWRNIRDVFRVIAGIWQSYRLLGKLKPEAMFTPGGFVGVPVGIASHLRGVPVVTHDLDALPGLANRINARWAVAHAVGQPKELYSYPSEATYYVGVPVGAHFRQVSQDDQKKAKQALGLKSDDLLVFVTGGGLGATRLNQAVISIVQELLDTYPGLSLIHTVGRGNEETVQTAYNRALSPKEIHRVHVLGYTTELYRYSAAADVVITRAGAVAMAELAVQHKASVVVPNPILTGGHQLKNVLHLEKDHAIKVVQEKELKTNSKALLPTVNELLGDPKARQTLGGQLGTYAKPGATKALAQLITDKAKRSS
ncbi:MAG TPA: UDP-N-acetylglucosamine--N-acetylmuramyl-(pentapeptide) pyrophosphoryl-undecaprenol N-acetylglucosamine transferase [Candidatus Saccharimonadales bacterium]|nr:UDP-N-acetylglucosamine--N-acetylmuramyl-(pentapeptide) pyrophosphoryl-undecaprenol N-acetylglucosamine transferase [Candidatus Saccharimonadales bacterium]